MIKLLIGGSPCTKWSIAQKNGRETKPEGEGWELFLNYLIAKEKFKPDFFLYENNKSAAQAIKDKVAEELGVGTDPKARFTYINSALVSAQNRQRFYVTNFGDIEQPEDRGILLKDILEDSVTDKDKAYCLKHQARNARDYFKKQHTNVKLEPVCVAQRGRYSDTGKRSVKGNGPVEQFYEAREDGKTNAITTVQKDNAVAEPVCMRYERSDEAKRIRKQYEAGKLKHGFHELHELHPRTDGKSNTLSTVLKDNPICEPVCVGELPGHNGKYKNGMQPSQQYRVYADFGKSVCVDTDSRRHYAIPVEFVDGIPIKAISGADGKVYTVYEVKDGLITIKDKQYPIKLKDGYYIIRKLTVTECCRLQTMPDDYCKAVSATQAYKGLGNGWTAEVIIHLLNHALKDVPKDEEIVVLSMYDGIGTGRYCLDKMGFTNVKYYAYEIDKYAMTVANDNYPDIIQCGDAFKVREEGWSFDG